MKVSIDVRIDDRRLFLIGAEQSTIPTSHSTYMLGMSAADDRPMVPFGEITSCAFCGLPELLERMLDFAVGPHGVVNVGERSDA